jgi:hypothetical protein
MHRRSAFIGRVTGVSITSGPADALQEPFRLIVPRLASFAGATMSLTPPA